MNAQALVTITHPLCSRWSVKRWATNLPFRHNRRDHTSTHEQQL